MEKEKYFYSKLAKNGKPIFYVYHEENDDVLTLIAKTDTAEKADFIAKACNQFDLEKYEISLAKPTKIE